ncbi:DUF4007 family protein [Croceitalea marina]|uniref:DUF4007 family protein n=1 Tax=Croceitalea marina TaxID=1775166 RepID=A0ABW5MV56_9FLAO
MSVFFHGSFGLNRSYMAGVLKTLIDSPSSSAEDIAKPFGFKAPFTNRYKAWLQKTGILKGKELTANGEIIFNNDSKLDTLVTQWYMHHQLTKSPINAEAWHFFIKEFLPGKSKFSRDELEQALGVKLMGHSVEHFSKGRPMNKRISRKLLDCYLQDEGLGKLGFLEVRGKNQYNVQQPREILGPWKNIQELSNTY